MCLLITKPANASIANDVLARAFQQNPDGLGVAYHDGTRRRVVKTLPQSVEDALAFCAQHARADYPAMIHFRWATHGSVNLANQHPFAVPNTDLVLAHNGVMPHDLMRSAERAIGELIGSGNKLAAMDMHGEFAWVNRSSGVEQDNGVWYSNSYALEDRKPARMSRGFDWREYSMLSTDSREYAYTPTLGELWDYAQIALEDYADEIAFSDFERWLSRFDDRQQAESALDNATPIDLVADMLGVVFNDADKQAWEL